MYFEKRKRGRGEGKRGETKSNKRGIYIPTEVNNRLMKRSIAPIVGFKQAIVRLSVQIACY